MLDGTEFFECTCYSDEHLLRFTLSLEDGPMELSEIYVSVYMDNRRGFWRRLWLALRYTFGYQSRYGAFGNWTMRYEDAARLRSMLDRLTQHVERQRAGVTVTPVEDGK